MVQLDTNGYVTIEIGTQRLPARMIAGRLGADLRTSRSLVASRRPRLGPLVIAMVAAMLVPLAGMARYRHASVAELPAR